MMRKFVCFSITATILGVHSSTYAGPLPDDWVRAESGMSSRSMSLFSRAEDLSEATKIYDHILDAKGDLIEKSMEVPTQRRWFLQSIMTEIGVAYDGQFGVLGSSGEKAVEMTFIRTPQTIRDLQEKYYGASTPVGGPDEPTTRPESLMDGEEPISLNSEMSQVELAKAVEQVVTVASKSGRITNITRFRRNLISKAMAFHQISGDLQSLRKLSVWYPYKLQLEIDFQSTGDVLPFMQVGAAFRAYLEWDIIEKKSKKPSLTCSDCALASANPNLSDNSRMLLNLGQDLTSLDELSMHSQTYSLCAFKIGFGMTAEGNIIVADTQAAAIGSVFYRRDSKAHQEPSTLSVASNDVFPIISEENRIYKASHRYFQKNLKKAVKIANFFTRGAIRHEERRKAQGKPTNFELKFLELEMKLSLNGGVALATVGGTGVMHLFLAKQNKK